MEAQGIWKTIGRQQEIKKTKEKLTERTEGVYEKHKYKDCEKVRSMQVLV